MGKKDRSALAQKLLGEHRDMSYRDMRDLLIEHEIDSDAAGSLCADRLAREKEAERRQGGR